MTNEGQVLVNLVPESRRFLAGVGFEADGTFIQRNDSPKKKGLNFV
jgi:hypothetical protein